MAHWYTIDPAELVWHAWPEAYSIYDRKSGQTHLLNELPAELLRCLEREPKTSAELTAHLGDILGTPIDADTQRAVEHALRQLQGLRLVGRSE